MDYLVNGRTYVFHYQNLKDKYNYFKSLTNEEFLKELPAVLHFACYVAYVKELSNEVTISDEGIIHELIHLLHIPDELLIDINKIRKKFNKLLELK